MKQELQERLLAAAQAVVADAESTENFTQVVDSEVFLDLELAVKAISDDAVRTLTEDLRQANGRHQLEVLAKELEDLNEIHLAHVRSNQSQPGDSVMVWECGCGAAMNYRIKAGRRMELMVSLGEVQDA